MDLRTLVNSLACVALLGTACFSGNDGGKPGSAEPTIGKKPDGNGRTKLWLSAEDRAGGPTVTVHFERGDSAAPRVADIRIAHSESVALVSSKRGAATAAAGKELTIQEPQPGLVRVILLSRDAREIETGELVKLDFKRTGGDKAKLDLLMDRPVFAPAESMQGLLIGDAIQL